MVQLDRQGTCLICPRGHAFHAYLKINDSPYRCYFHSWLTAFIAYKHVTGLSDTKFPGKLILVTIVEYKKIFRLHQDDYIQVHQEDEA